MDRDGIEKFEAFDDPNKIGEKWLNWRRNFKLFLMTKNVKTEGKKLAYLLLKAGTDVQRIYTAKKESIEKDDDHEVVSEFEEALQILDGEFLLQRNDSFQRALFRRIVQEPNESILSFVSRLRSQVKYCGIESEKERERAVKDQIMDKCSSHKLKQEMWKEDRDLNGLMKLAQSLENAEIYEKNFKAQDNAEQPVNWINNNKRFKPSYKGSSSKSSGLHQQDQTKDPSACWNCGKTGHMKGSSMCPAKGKQCLECKRIGHFSTVCRSKKGKQTKFSQKSNVRAIESDSDNDTEETEYILNVDDGSSDTVDCKVGGVTLKMVVDSGSKRNLIPMKVWEKMKSQKVNVKQQIKGSDVTTKAYGQDRVIPVHGRFLAELEVNGIKTDQWFYIVLPGDACLLGKTSSIVHKILQIGTQEPGKVYAVESSEFPKLQGNSFMNDWL